MTPEKPKRMPRDRRPPQPKPMRITGRDGAMLEAIQAYRLLSTRQIQALFFPSLHRAYARMELLYRHSYVDRIFLGTHTGKMNTALLYVLDRRGAEWLRAYRGHEVEFAVQHKRVTPMFLEHTLAINDVRIAVSLACQQSGRSLLNWISENDLKADYDYVVVSDPNGRRKRLPLIPDGYFVIDTPYPNKAHFFLELDRGTMTAQRFKVKIDAYRVYAESGLSQKRFGAQKYRVLTVTLGDQRAQNLKRATENVGGKNRFWFVSLDRLSAATVLSEPIWYVATKEGREALFGE